MKEEEPADGKKMEDEGIGKENLAILEKIKKNQRQDYLNVRVLRRAGGLGAVPGHGYSSGSQGLVWLLQRRLGLHRGVTVGLRCC